MSTKIFNFFSRGFFCRDSSPPDEHRGARLVRGPRLAFSDASAAAHPAKPRRCRVLFFGR